MQVTRATNQTDVMAKGQIRDSQMAGARYDAYATTVQQWGAETLLIAVSHQRGFLLLVSYAR